MIVYRLAERMKIGVQTELETTFDGEIAKAPLDFPGGIKVFSLFQISLENYFKTKFYLGIHLRMQLQRLKIYTTTSIVLRQESVGVYKAKNKQQADQQEQQEKQSAATRSQYKP